MIGVGLLRGVFLGGIMMWYSMSVWKTVDQYFRDQFQEYLMKEYQENDAMKQDVLVEKERIETRKMLLAKLIKLESAEKGRPEPEQRYLEELDLEISDVSESTPDSETAEGNEWTGYSQHGDYSAEEVVSSHVPGDVSEAILDDYEAMEEGTESGEDGGDGECLVEDCGGHDGQVSTKWRNVFDEDGEVCHFDEHLGAKESCSQPDDVWEEVIAMDENN